MLFAPMHQSDHCVRLHISHQSDHPMRVCILHQSDSLTWENQERSWKYIYILQVLEAKDQQIKLLQQQLVSKLTYLFHHPDSNITSPYCLQYIFWVALRMCCWIKQNPPYFMTHIAITHFYWKKCDQKYCMRAIGCGMNRAKVSGMSKAIPRHMALKAVSWKKNRKKWRRTITS